MLEHTRVIARPSGSIGRGNGGKPQEPKRLRLRLFSIPARYARTGRRRLLHLAATAPFTALALEALTELTRLTATPRIASG